MSDPRRKSARHIPRGTSSALPAELHRREILAALVGLPLLAGCSQSPAKATTLQGEIVGPSSTLGHRLRSADRQTPPTNGWSNCEVAIVGGGIAGLTAAWRLKKAGCRDFALLEMESTVGGTSRSGQSSVSAFPWGAHYLPVPMQENTDLISLLDEIGILDGRDADGEPLVAEQVLCRDPQERVFYKGRWYEGLYLAAGASTDDRTQYNAFQAEMNRWAGWRDARGRRAFALPTSAGSDDEQVAALDRMSMAQWLDQHHWNSARLRWYIDYCCRDDYGASSAQTSAWAGVFYFASRIRKAGDRAQQLITWPEGNGHLVEHLAAGVNENIRLGWLAVDIVPQPDANGVDVVMMNAKGDAVRGLHAKKVIFAGPQFIAGHIVSDYRHAPPPHIAEFQYGPWLVANLTLHARPANSGFPLAWDNVLYESRSLGYVTATHQACVDYGPTVLTFYHAFADGDPQKERAALLAMEWEQCAEFVVKDLERAHPEIRSLVDRVDVMRWGHAMIRPRSGFIFSPARTAAARPYRGIHFANTDLSGIALFEEAFYHGLRAADEVLATLKVHAGNT